MALQTIANDWEYYFNDEVAVCNNVWHKGSYENGKDFRQTITFDPQNLLKNVSIAWDWPAGPSWDVVSYPEIIVGYKPWGEVGATNLSSQVNELKNFKVEYSISLHGGGENNNIAFEFWLTDQSLGNELSINTEIMIWVHHDAMTPPGQIVGTYRSDAGVADIYSYKSFGTDVTDVQWDYVTLNFREDTLSGNLNFKEILGQLAKMDLVSKNDYVGGFELGAEVNGGKDGFTVDSLAYQMDRKTMGATQGKDKLVGTENSDNLDGGQGGDVIRGKAGADVLLGGKGYDIVVGGQGADIFMFDGIGAKNSDIVKDFVSGEDQIHIKLTSLNLDMLGQGSMSIADAGELEDRFQVNTLDNGLYFDLNQDGRYTSNELIATIDGDNVERSDIFVL